MQYVAVASAAYAEVHCPQGLTPHNFRQLPSLPLTARDDLQTDFVSKACGLRRVALSQRFVPSTEGQVRAVQAGWGVSVLPELQVRELLVQGALVNLAPQTRLSINLYWHCWNLDSVVIDRPNRGTVQHSARGAGASKPAPELAHQ